AVAWGLLVALRLSVARAGLAPRTADALARRVLRLVSPPAPSPAALRGMPDLLAGDKKADRAGLRAVLLAGPGRPTLVRVERIEVEGALEETLARYNRVGWVSPVFRA
ncbi:MAG: hypothetical protein NEA02_16790, partial [Thermoanaerobaculia bacterium]|nr:hypothetical protein [Thermoanaerobaculia bacterium]